MNRDRPVVARGGSVIDASDPLEESGSTVIIDVYHPLVSSDHEATCAALCTNWCASTYGHGCQIRHRCWCPDGALSYGDFQAKYPEVTVAEA